MTPAAVRTALAGAILLAAAGAAAIAQDSRLSSTPPADPAPKKDILSGPKVEDRSVPGVQSQFGEQMDPRQRAIAVPNEVFMRIVRSLGEEETPADAKLTPEQRQQIQTIADNFQAESRAFMRQNMEELRTLREQTGVRGNQGNGAPQRPAAGAPLSDEERAKLVARLQELNNARPSPDAAHTQIYAVLNPAQQEIVRTQVDQWTDQQIEQRAMQRLKTLKAQRQNDSAKPADGNKPARPTPPQRTLPDDDSRGAAQALAAQRLGLDPANLEQIREILAAPPTDAEKGTPYLQRLTTRIDNLPAKLATPEQKDKLKAFLLERVEQRTGRRPQGV